MAAFYVLQNLARQRELYGPDPRVAHLFDDLASINAATADVLERRGALRPVRSLFGLRTRWEGDLGAAAPPPVLVHRGTEIARRGEGYVAVGKDRMDVARLCAAMADGSGDPELDRLRTRKAAVWAEIDDVRGRIDRGSGA